MECFASVKVRILIAEQPAATVVGFRSDRNVPVGIEVVVGQMIQSQTPRWIAKPLTKHQAVLTSLIGSFANQPANRNWDILAHDCFASSSDRIRAFTNRISSSACSY